MGTRADFYVGKGEEAEWLGSIAWDGYIDGIDGPLRNCSDESLYRRRVADFLAKREDATHPTMGWPWPWEDSRTTDYAYTFDGGRVYAACFGRGWIDAAGEPPQDEDGYEDWEELPKQTFPDMTDRKAVTLGKRSGVLLIEGPAE